MVCKHWHLVFKTQFCGIKDLTDLYWSRSACISWCKSWLNVVKIRDNSGSKVYLYPSVCRSRDRKGYLHPCL